MQFVAYVLNTDSLRTCVIYCAQHALQEAMAFFMCQWRQRVCQGARSRSPQGRGAERRQIHFSDDDKQVSTTYRALGMQWLHGALVYKMRWLRSIALVLHSFSSPPPAPKVGGCTCPAFGKLMTARARACNSSGDKRCSPKRFRATLCASCDPQEYPVVKVNGPPKSACVPFTPSLSVFLSSVRMPLQSQHILILLRSPRPSVERGLLT